MNGVPCRGVEDNVTSPEAVSGFRRLGSIHRVLKSTESKTLTSANQLIDKTDWPSTRCKGAQLSPLHDSRVMGSITRAFAACLMSCVMLFSQRLCAEDVARWPITMVDSASLHAVECIDEQFAWAVGERGAILFTTDGGATWSLNHARLTDHTLYGVSFADRQHGILVGGNARPYHLPSAGTILRTDDAGRTWDSVERTMLPELRRVAHTDARTAIAIGESSPLFLSGIFRTTDSGRSWNCIPNRSMQCWQRGDLTNPNQLLLTSSEGRIWRCANSKLVDSPPADAERVDLRDAAWISSDRAIAVGGQGTLLETHDQGKTWEPLASLTRIPLSQQFDFRTVWARQGFIWLAGSPGTHVFRSTDGGLTWGVAETRQSLPLNCLDFSDPQHGLAVGDFGVILVTRDGGATWSVSRGRDYRAGALVVCQTPADIPFDLVTQLSSIDQLRCHVVIAEGSAPAARQASTAAKWVGADNVEQLCDSSQAAVTTQLVRRLLAYRPDVIVVVDRGHRQDGEGSLLRDVKRAVQITGDASVGGKPFAPWRVKRLFHCTSSPNGDGLNRPSTLITVNPTDPVGPLRGSISAASLAAYSFMQEPCVGLRCSLRHGTPTQSSCFVSDALGEQPAIDASFLGGLQLPWDSASRRPLPESTVDDVWLRRQATVYHTTLSLLERGVSTSPRVGGEQLAPLTRNLSPEDRARALMWVVGRCQQHGRSTLAQQTLDAILQLQSRDVHETAAAMARFRWSASAELGHFLQRQSTAVPTLAAGTNIDAIQQTGYVDSHHLPSIERRLNETLGARSDGQAWLEQLAPDVTSQPWVQLAAASMRRRAADPADRQRIYKLLKNKVVSVDWRRCIAIEAWLADLQPDPRRPMPPGVIFVPRTSVPPVLDGKLDEPLWGDAATLQLAAPRANDRRSTLVRVATDEKYLFVGIDCEGGEPHLESHPSPGPRDADIGEVDHVDLCLDVNRDYSTGWQISVDCRGWAGDRVDGDPDWNPKWHLATQGRPTGWMAELAIPLDELTAELPLTDRCSSTWLAGMRRSMAGADTQTWPNGAGAGLPWQRCGYLVLNDGRDSVAKPD